MEPLDLLNVAETFREYFELVPALFEDLRDAAFRVRHQVYCQELGFEPVRPDGRETDEYDAHSLHCLLRSVQTQEYVGCVRLVLARPDDPSYPLPFERTCAATLDRSIIDSSKLPRDRIAEVSRLAVIRRFRRRKGEDKMPVGVGEQDFGTLSQPRFPYIPLALYFGSVALAAHHGIERLFVLTEPRLAQHFGKLGVKIDAIGAAVEHRGKRIPSMLTVQEIPGALRRVVKPLYAVAADEIDNGLWLRK